MAQHHPGLGDLGQLPREVRDLTYEHYFAGALVYQERNIAYYVDDRSKPTYRMPKMARGLLHVSKAIRKEAEPYQYSNITLDIVFERCLLPEHICRAATSVIVESLNQRHPHRPPYEFRPFDAQPYKTLTTLHIRNTTRQTKGNQVGSGPVIELEESKIKQYLQDGRHEDYILEAIREKWSLFEDPLPVVNYHGPRLMVRTSLTAGFTGEGTPSGFGLYYNKFVKVTLVGKPWRIECITYLP